MNEPVAPCRVRAFCGFAFNPHCSAPARAVAEACSLRGTATDFIWPLCHGVAGTVFRCVDSPRGPTAGSRRTTGAFPCTDASFTGAVISPWATVLLVFRVYRHTLATAIIPWRTAFTSRVRPCCGATGAATNKGTATCLLPLVKPAGAVLAVCIICDTGNFTTRCTGRSRCLTVTLTCIVRVKRDRSGTGRRINTTVMRRRRRPWPLRWICRSSRRG